MVTASSADQDLDPDANLEPDADREPMPHERSGPLNGVRVLELGSLIAGRLPADWGAEVVKIESRERPDPMREWDQGALDGQQVW